MTSTTLETSQRYTDGKRYWWLLGLVVYSRSSTG